MKALVCGVCGFIPLKGAAPKNCPVCNTPEKGFKEDDEAIQLPKDSENLEGLELKHVPRITKTGCGLVENECLDVHVLMGEVIHPMTEEHFITHIDFYVDEEYAGRIMLTPKGQPAGSLHLKKGGSKLTIVQNCNLHGNWINSISL
jgi:superoxide reductase